MLRYFGIQNPEIAYRALTAILVNRKAARTAGGHVGLVPMIAEVGDFIMLCEGGKLPLILRPRDDEAGKDGKKVKEWEFIGDCYIHGVMEGEKWDEKAPGKCERVIIT